MKKALPLLILLSLQLFVKAQCPLSMPLYGNTSIFAGNTIPSGSSLPCNSPNFYIWPEQPANLVDPHQDIFTPCIMTEFNPLQVNTTNNGTENIYEGGAFYGCVGPSGCSFPIGYSAYPYGGIWDLYASYFDPNQQHDFSFCKSATVGTLTVTLKDCWSGAIYQGPTVWNNASPACFTLTTAANTPIGTANWSISPFVAGALTDFKDGIVRVNTSTLGPGTYVMTYSFTGSQCALATATYTLNITNPYNASWTAPTNLCSNSACVSLPPTVTGTSGGSWSGTGVSGTQFCPTTSGPGSFPVTYSVGISAACSATQTNTITVTATPTLSISGTNTVCAGGSVVLTGGTAAGYTWSPSGGNASTATVTPGGSTQYTLTGANGNCTNSTTFNVTVNPIPTINVSSNAGSICSGSSATLTAGGATTYTWSGNAGGGNGNPVVITPSTTDTYTVSGSTSGCSSSQVVTVTVTPTPTVNASASAGTICAGQTTTLTASGASNYTWQPGGSTANPLPVTPGATAQYTVTGDNAGCVSSPQVVTVNVNPLPTINVSAAPPSLCTGQSTTLTASGANTYTWSPNAGGGTTNPVVVSPTTTDTYTCTATDNNGCTNQGTVTVNMGTTVPITITAASNTVCSGQSITLNGSGATNYTWSPGGQNTGTITVTPSGSTTYTLNGDNGSCTGSQTVAVTVIPTPTVTTSAASNTLCSGGSTTITGGGATNYTWMPGGATTSTISVNPNTTATYTLTGETSGCSNTSAITITVTPTPTVTASASSGTLCAGQSVVLTAGGAGSYTWMPGGSTNSTVTVTPGSSTTYTLTGANGNCTANTTTQVNVTPLPNVTANASSNSICAGQSTTITGSGATSYTWMPGGATTSTISANPATSTSYTLTGSAAGCTNTAVASITVTPTPTLVVSAASGTLCSGQSTTLNGAGATNYTWMPGGSNSASPSITPTVSTTYTVTGETAGCSATSTVAVVVNPTPTIANVPAVDSALCGNPTGGVTQVVVTGGTPAYTYQWYNGSTPISGATADSLSNMPAGTYSVLITDANGCVLSGASTIFTIPGSSPVIAGITPILSQGQAPLVVSFGNVSVGASAYYWDFGNGANSTQVAPGTSYNTVGSYTVMMIASNGGCVDTAYALVIVDQSTSILVPNVFSPNGDGINDGFYIVNTGLTSLNCDIFNRWGQRMFTLTAPQSIWDGTAPNGNPASDGTYYYILTAHGTDGQDYHLKGTVTLVK